MIKFSSTSPNATSGAATPKKTGVMKATTASRAVHGTSGIITIVSSRALGASITRVPATDGTLQPKPRNSGKNDLPCRPIRRMKPSIKYAARAM